MKDPVTGLRARCPTYAGVRSGSDRALGRDGQRATSLAVLTLSHCAKSSTRRHGAPILYFAVLWRRWELNPRPQSRARWRLRACPALWISPSARLAGGVAKGQPDRWSPRAAQAGVPGTVARLLTRLVPSQAPGAKARYLVCARQRARIRDYDPHVCCCRGFTRPPAPRLATTPTNRPRRSLSSPGVCFGTPPL